MVITLNRIYGKLEVLSYSKKDGYTMACCQCECGTIKNFYLSNLKSGKTKSCGCSSLRNYRDISGLKFGNLMAIEPTTKREKCGGIIWRCKCDCGQVIECSTRCLVHGYTKNCGCIRKKNYDLSGKKFGNLIVIKPIGTKINSRTKWSCQCDCGGTTITSHYNLVSQHTRSCGCLWKKEYRTFAEGTIVECLKSKKPKNNSSGIKGVCCVNGKWLAYITLAQKRFYLGRYDSLQEAKASREQAEKEKFWPIIKKYKKVGNDSNQNV